MTLNVWRKKMYFFRLFRDADPKTKSFVLNVIYLGLLVLWSLIWPYYHLEKDRTRIPRQSVQQSSKAE